MGIITCRSDQLHLEIMSCGNTEPDTLPFLMEKAATAGVKPMHAQTELTGLIFSWIWAGIKHECLLACPGGWGYQWCDDR